MAADTSLRLRRAAVELFASKGFAATGIRELADRVGITTSTLYHHVDSKDDLLDDIIERVMAALIAVGRYWLNHPGDHATRLAGLVGSHVVIHSTAPAEVVVVDRQLAAMRPISRQRAIAGRDAYEQCWRTIVADGTADGSFSVADPKLATLALLGATTAVADWYRPGGSLDGDKLASRFAEMALDLLNARTSVPVPDLAASLDPFRRRWEDQP